MERLVIKYKRVNAYQNNLGNKIVNVYLTYSTFQNLSSIKMI